MSEEILEGLKDKFSPMDAHDVLTKHGGRDKDWHSLSFEHKSSLIDLAKKSKYNHKSPTGRSRGYSFHLALNKIADKAVNLDGTLKRKDMKESENLEELSKQKMAKYMNKAVYDNKNKKRQKGLDTAVKRMSKESEDYEGENLEESSFPTDKNSWNLGYAHRHEIDDDNRMHMYKEHGVFHIRGFKNGKHFVDSTRTLTDAKKRFNVHKRDMNKNESIEHNNENLEEALHPLDAHRILNQHGGRNKSFFSMSSDQHESLADTAKSMGYRHNKHSGKSYARAFHDHLNRTADAHVTEDGKLKPKSKWNNPPSMHEETENLDELSKRTLRSYVGKASQDATIQGYNTGKNMDDMETAEKYAKKAGKRNKGIGQALYKMSKEEYENENFDELDEARTPAESDHEMAKEIFFHGINPHLNNSSASIVNNLKRKHAKGNYDHEMATKAWEHHSKRSFEDYKKVHGSKDMKTSPATHRDAAKMFRDHYDENVRGTNMKESISYFSDFILEGNGNDAVDIFENMISEKLLNRLNEKREEICEELFSLDELSKKTLGNYINKAIVDYGISNARIGMNANNDKEDKKVVSRANKRYSGLKKATNKLTKESYENLDELSKKTLGNYINKASRAKDAALYALGRMHNDTSETGKKENEYRRKRFMKREKGINAALNKLTKESYENLDEMARTANPLDHRDALQIHLYGDNDHDLYQNSAQHIIKNLQRKHAKGNYDHEMATKAWEHHAKRALKKHNQEFPEHRIKGGAATIKKAAEHFRDGYDEEVRGS